MASQGFRQRRMSMTSLIDVIFLLLLFFMLSSTFSRFSEIEIAAAGAGQGAPTGEPPLFIQLSAESISINAQAYSLDSLDQSPLAQAAPDAPVNAIVSVKGQVDAQTLVSFLVATRAFPNASITVLGR